MFFSKTPYPAHCAPNTVQVPQDEIRNFLSPKLRPPTAQSLNPIYYQIKDRRLKCLGHVQKRRIAEYQSKLFTGTLAILTKARKTSEKFSKLYLKRYE